MRDRVAIIAGLLAFVALFTFPFWRGVAAHTSTAEPQLQLPKGQAECVAPLSVMRASHMKLLLEWREGRVREDRPQYTSFDGRTYKVSLSGTCLSQCHGSKQQFCDRCHSYAGIATPTCWSCHQDAPSSSLVASAGGGRTP